jgi:hypothetical protein
MNHRFSDLRYCRFQVLQGNCRVASEHPYNFVPGYFHIGDRHPGSVGIGIKGMPQVVKSKTFDPCPFTSSSETALHLRYGLAPVGEHGGHGQAPGHGPKHINQFCV